VDLRLPARADNYPARGARDRPPAEAGHGSQRRKDEPQLMGRFRGAGSATGAEGPLDFTQEIAMTTAVLSLPRKVEPFLEARN
jgi:hypothetical protein